MGKKSRDKGARRERELVNLLKDLGFTAERVPLSGGTRYRQEGHDVTANLGGTEWHLEVKARGDGEGFKTIQRWLAGSDALVLMADRQPPLIVLPLMRFLGKS